MKVLIIDLRGEQFPDTIVYRAIAHGAMLIKGHVQDKCNIISHKPHICEYSHKGTKGKDIKITLEAIT